MKKETLILLLILLLGFVLRFAYLSQIPPELNRDEASVGFNAYSLLKTGRDEHGRGPWPLVFRAFGDYKIPGYIYLVVPLIKIFGLSAFSVRLPAAFFGFLTLVTIYFLTKEIYPQKRNLSLFFPLLLAVSPFHLHYSRQQFEAPVALFFNLTATLFLLKGRKNKKMIWLSFPFFIISFFIYNSPLFIVPSLVFWTLFLYRKEFFQNFKSKIIVGLFVLSLVGGWLTYWSLVKEGNQGRANTTIFNQEGTVEQINYNIFFLTKRNFPLLLARIFHNKPWYWFREYMKNYLAAFNPKFIFFTSDNNPWHSLGYLNFGNILVIFLPFIFIGFLEIIRGIKRRRNLWLLGYFFISPIANGLTIDSPILTRLLDFHLILVFFAALGLEIFFYRQAKFFKLKNFLVLGLLFFSVINYLINYFIVFPQDMPDFWLPGIKKASQYIKENEKEYDLVIFNPQTDVGYIFLAFYLPFNPADFQKKAKRITVGFDTVVSYDKYIFDHNIVDIDNNEFLKGLEAEKKSVLIIKRLQKEKGVHTTQRDIFIYDSLGRALWQITRLKKQ